MDTDIFIIDECNTKVNVFITKGDININAVLLGAYYHRYYNDHVSL